MDSRLQAQPCNLYRFETRKLSKEDDDFLEQYINTEAYIVIRLYIFADRFNVPLLRRAIIDKQWLLAQDFYAPFLWHHVIYALRNLPPSSPLCRVLIYQYTKHWTGFGETCGLEQRLRGKLPANFLFGVITEQTKLLEGKQAL